LLQIERSFRSQTPQQIASAASQGVSERYSEMPAITAVTRLFILFAAAPLSKLHAIVNARRRIAKAHFLRICTDIEINVVVKPEQVCLRGDRYVTLEGML
jgi:hypothetical protein